MTQFTRRNLLSGVAGLSVGRAAARKYNVVFFLTDDQRQDTIHALGNPVIQTPNLDALVNSGVTFPNAYCMGGHSPAVCLPSRMMIQRGISWFSALRQKLPLPNLAATMNGAGYVTYQFTKRGNIDVGAQKSYTYTDYPEPSDEADRTQGQPGRQMADRALGFLSRWKKDPKVGGGKPFFLYLASASPHDPRVAAPEYLAKYNPKTLALPRNFKPFHPFDNGELFVRDERLAPWPRTGEEIRRQTQEYYAVISQMDHHIGRIVEAIRQSGEFENTIFIFSSDQGIALGSHGLMGKQNLYEHSMKPGLIFAGPGIPKGRRVDAFAYLFDIFPTICELTGVHTPESLEGRSLAPVLHGQTKQAREVIFLGYKDLQRAVRHGPWKLIRYPRIDRNQLFNLDKDPDELNDLSLTPKHDRTVRDLLDLMEEQQKQYGDTAPLRVSEPQRAEVDLEFYRKAPPETPARKR